MTISMYETSVGSFVRVLNNLSAVLAKGAAHAETKKIDPAVLLSCRLYPDMFPLTRQVQIATDGAKGCVARLAGVEPPSFPDNESSFAELEARIRKTIDYVQSFKPEQINGSEARAVTLKLRNGEMNFEGLPYLLGFVLPNLYFHASTTYNILRHNGVELGKMDFLGKP
ncbi:MAG: hypothetical protein JWR16_878 [Nevskia sp.]|nr:hypothetical protein [Nevskia sp.]